MGDMELNLLSRAALFALGMALILAAIADITVSAGYVSSAAEHLNVSIFGIDVAISSAITGFIGSYLVFISWNTEEADKQ